MKAFVGVFGLSLLSAMADSKKIPLGVEAVTGVRTDYIFRGFRMASTSLDFQMEAEIALDDDTFFNLGAWYLAGGNNSFRETGVFMDFRREISEKLTLGSSLTYRDFQNGPLTSGLELGVFGTYQLTDDWDLKSALYYDFESSGWYGETSLGWSYPVSDSSFFSTVTGFSYVSDYFGRNGFNDVFARATFTYGFSDSVAFSPFLGASFQLDGSQGDDEVYAGLLFEVLF